MFNQSNSVSAAAININDPITYGLDERGMVVFIRGSVKEVIGLEPSNVIGRPWSFLVWREDRENAQWHFNERRTGKRATRRYPLRLISWHDETFLKKWVIIEVNATGVYESHTMDNHKKFLGTVGYLSFSGNNKPLARQADSQESFNEIDLAGLSQLLTAEKERQEIRYMFGTLFDSIKEPMLLLDNKMCVRMINQEGMRYFSCYEHEKIIGYPCYVGLCKQKAPCPGCRVLQMTGMEGDCRYERAGIVKPETIEEIYITSMEKEAVSGMKYMIVRISDITQQRLLENQLIDSARLMSVGRQTAGIVHEIRTSLSSVQLLVDLLEGYASSSDQRKIAEIFDEVKVNISHTKDIVTLLLKLAGKKSCVISKEKIDINYLINQSLKLGGYAHSGLDVSLELKLKEYLKEINGDGIMIQLALQNVIQNAYDAVGTKGSVCISTDEIFCDFSPGRCAVVIEVNDDGPGLMSQNSEEYFHPFFTTKREGVGLGLFISRKIIKQHNGVIRLSRCKDNVGTSVQIILPVTNEEIDQPCFG